MIERETVGEAHRGLGRYGGPSGAGGQESECERSHGWWANVHEILAEG